VLETHIHNDYVSGGLELASTTGAAYVVPALDDVSFERLAVADGDELSAEAMTVRAIHTPGHTRNHFSYAVREGGGWEALFSGGSMLFGTTGRTDLLGPELTEDLTRAQYHSVRRLAAELPHKPMYTLLTVSAASAPQRAQRKGTRPLLLRSAETPR